MAASLRWGEVEEQIPRKIGIVSQFELPLTGNAFVVWPNVTTGFGVGHGCPRQFMHLFGFTEPS
jgi:hypothetical protein